LVTLALLLAAAPMLASNIKALEFFETQVRPVLAKHCHACHTDSRIANLRVDSREYLIQGGRSGPAIVPGDPDNSLLMQAVSRTHARLKMPPAARLSPDEIENLKAWIKDGAVWPDSPAAQPAMPSGEYRIKPEQRAFWSFQPVRRPAIPAGKGASSAIDRFILSRLRQEGLEPNAKANKSVLIRRASFDLTGLPPTLEELDAFERDTSAEAFEKVVDRLLASKRYGERWGRHWLDLARYSDGQLGAARDEPFPGAHRYRDWVIGAFNSDMPYDQFIKAQLAADLLPAGEREKMLPALGFHGLMPGGDDRVDVTTRVFLGLTAGCAQCHDHKFDPIPTMDYYSLLGVFRSTEKYEIPLAPDTVVQEYKTAKKRADDLNLEINEFIARQSTQLAGILAEKTARYLVTAFPLVTRQAADIAAASAAAGLDREILDRWVQYLASDIDHPFLKPYLDLAAGVKAGKPPDPARIEKCAAEVQAFVTRMFTDKHGMDDRNYVALGGTEGARVEAKRQYTNLESLDIQRYYFWRDLASEPYKKDFVDVKGGVYYFGAKNIERWLSPVVAEYLAQMRARHETLKKAIPEQYPLLHGFRDKQKPANLRVMLRGNPETLGEEAPRRFLQILSDGEPARFRNGSGRLELAEAIASKKNPLTARVMVNRLWQHHFGHGLVRTPGNFGQLGERPSHQDLLDYLASRFMENDWSVKAMHREIMLSDAYQRSSADSPKQLAADPENRLLWRANLRPRLDVESLRDAMLSVAGNLDLRMGGPSEEITEKNTRRTIYGTVGRTKLNPTLALFDFPNPNSMADERMATVGPMQRLYFMNSPFVAQQARLLGDRLQREGGQDDAARIRFAYRLLYARAALPDEIRDGLDFLADSDRSWAQYAQVLLAASEFSSLR
jgi:hypothetical protein